MTDQSELTLAYRLRFGRHAAYRSQVWRVLHQGAFGRFVKPTDAVLDLGCGWGEFINGVRARERYGMDLNPDSASHLQEGVTFLHQDCSEPWQLPDGSLDVVFTSNFFEHLPSKEHLTRTVKEAHRCLRAGGLLVCIGPNIRYLGGSYWDFFDHHLPISDAALEELLTMTGFSRISVRRRFLPYTMSRGWQPPLALVRFYLRWPWLWRLFGKQFLVTAAK